MATKLEGLQEKLKSERAEVLAELDRLREYLRSEVDTDVEEGDPELHEREKNLALMQSLEHKLSSIDHALFLIKGGRYGICEECGRPINPERLKVLPYATLCLLCKLKREKMAKREWMAY